VKGSKKLSFKAEPKILKKLSLEDKPREKIKRRDFSRLLLFYKLKADP
jgi:hypothetical protein